MRLWMEPVKYLGHFIPKPQDFSKNTLISLKVPDKSYRQEGVQNSEK